MNKYLTRETLTQVESIALKAGEAIMDIYKKDFEIYEKNDQSPLTEADLAAHNIIESELKKAFPEVPILSEESSGVTYEDRKGWDVFWMVDPLDGTKEFIKKNDEFTVNIALIVDGQPVLGVVYAPVLNITYSGAVNLGAVKKGAEGRQNINTVQPKGTSWLLVGSRSHRGEHMDKYLEAFDSYEFLSKGSSLKLCMVAEGTAHLYPRLGPTSEWDTAAAHAILEGAGGKVNKVDGSNLSYGKLNILNPNFIARGRELVEQQRNFR